MTYYNEIIDNLKLEDVKNLLDKLDIPYKENNDALIMPTVCHHADIEEASWKLYYYKDNHFFYCYSEDGGMSIFKFLEHYYEVRDISYNWYDDIYSVVANLSSFNADEKFTQRPRVFLHDKYKVNEQPVLPTYPNGVLDIFSHYYPQEWLNDNISKAAMDKFGILFSFSRNKIIIPHFNENGELVGIRGRALNAEEVEIFGKYMPIKIEEKWYSHPLSLNLYGLDKNKDNIRKNGICYLFEAE